MSPTLSGQRNGSEPGEDLVDLLGRRPEVGVLVVWVVDDGAARG